MAIQIGVVTDVVGSVVATDEQGSRALQVGDPVFSDETIRTADGGYVEIRFLDGTSFDLGGNSVAVLDADVFDPDAATGTEAPTDGVIASVQEIQAALLAGEDPTEDEEAPAAGEGASGEEGGHGFVYVEHDSPAIDPQDGFATNVLSIDFAQENEVRDDVPEEDFQPPLADDDSAQVVEGNSVAGSVIDAGDSFGTGGAGAPPVANAGNYVGTYGTLTLNDDGTYEYVANPGLDHSGPPLVDEFDYVLQDADGNTSTGTLSIDVTDTVPTANPDANTVQEGDVDADGTNNQVSGNVLGNDDPSQDLPVVVSAVGGEPGDVGAPITTALGGTLVLNADGSYTYTAPDSVDNSGGDPVDTVTYTVTDADGSTATSTLEITVTDGGPLANPDVNTVQEGDSDADGTNNQVGGNVLGNDEQGPDNSITVTAVDGDAGNVGNAVTTALGGTLVINADGSYTYTAPDSVDNSGGDPVDTVQYTITDADGSTSTSTLQITITDNPGPDPEDDNPANNPEATVVDEALGDGDGTPGEVFTPVAINGNVLDNDAFGGDGQGAPPLTDVGYDGALGAATKNDDGTDITFTSDDGVWVLVVNKASGDYTFTLNDRYDHQGAQNAAADGVFTYTVQDGDGSTATADLTIRVLDDVPVANDDTDATVEGQTINGNVITGVGADGDPAGGDDLGADTGAVTEVSGNGSTESVADGTPGVIVGQYGTLTLNSDGSYSYQANAAVPGDVVDVFSYTVTDEDGDTDSAELRIAVGDANSPDPEDDNPLNKPEATVVDEALGDGDGTPGEVFTPVAINGNVLDNDAFGGDGQGAPPLTDVGYDGALGAATKNDDGTDITFTSDDGVWVLVINKATGDYTFTLNDRYDHQGAQNAAADGVFTYTVQDGDGSTATADLTIRVLDDVPVANDDTDTAGSGDTINGNVITGAGADGDPAGGDDLGADTGAVTEVSGNGSTESVADGTPGVIIGQYGTLTLSSDGSYQYEANDDVDDAVEDVFTYTVTDADGDISTATLTITLEPGVLVVGRNVDDEEGSDTPHEIPSPFDPDGAGPIDGTGGRDVLVGDVGGVQTENQPINLVLVLDVSGSMNDDGVDGNGEIQPLGLLKDAMQQLVNAYSEFAQDGAGVVVRIMPFANSADLLNMSASFDLATEAGRQAALDFIEFLEGQEDGTAAGQTDYESVLDALREYLDDPGAADNALPGGDPDYANDIVYFVSDGNPNVNHPTGTNRAIHDFKNFAILNAVQVHAVALGDGASTRFLHVVDTTNGAQLIEDANDLAPTLLQNVEFGQPGADVISGDGGDDIIFGDVLNTDHLPSTTFGDAGEHDGMGFDALVAFLTDENGGAAPTVQQIKEYIEGNWQSLAVGGDPRGNDDEIMGGAGDDILIGQGGNDIIVGGAGDDTIIGGVGNDTMTGGDGADRFVYLTGDQGETLETRVYNFVGKNDGLVDHEAFEFIVDPASDAEGLNSFAGADGSGTLGFSSNAEANAADYTALGAADGSRWETVDPPGGTGRHSNFLARFKVDEDPADVREINVRVDAVQPNIDNADPGDFGDEAWMGIYNHATGEWETLEATLIDPASAGHSYRGSVSGNAEDYIGADGFVSVVLYNEDAGDPLEIDYAEISVIYANGDPAVDTITDFEQGAGGDVLVLGDLLPDGISTDAADLTEYLRFDSDGTDTVVHVDHDGGAVFEATQDIVLEGVDLTQGGSLNDQQIIQSLMDQGNLDVS